jgi:transposase
LRTGQAHFPVTPLTTTDPKTGENREAYVFVAVLGASSYAYAEATWTRNLWDWIGSHTRAFEYVGETSSLVVPDNWRSGLKTPCWYEPELNRTHAFWAPSTGTLRPGGVRPTSG